MEYSDLQKAAIHADFLRLRRELQAEGLFRVSPLRLAFDVLTHVLLFSASWALSASHPAPAFLLATIAAINLVWWIHDCGHDSFSPSKAVSKTLIEALGVLFLGMPQIEYHYSIHRRHHGFTNVLGKDTALETGPVIWHPEMEGRTAAGFLPFQGVFWLCFVLPLTYPLITFRCLLNSWQKKQYSLLCFFAARWVFVLGVLGLSPVLLVAPVLIAGFVLGFAASLNHFSMPIAPTFPLPYPGHVFLITQNISAKSRFATWITGGLNFHVEHHLFPTMPSRNYRLVTARVQEFARKHRLPYHTAPTVEASRRLLHTLRDPIGRRELRRELT